MYTYLWFSFISFFKHEITHIFSIVVNYYASVFTCMCHYSAWNQGVEHFNGTLAKSPRHARTCGHAHLFLFF